MMVSYGPEYLLVIIVVLLSCSLVELLQKWFDVFDGVGQGRNAVFRLGDGDDLLIVFSSLKQLFANEMDVMGKTVTDCGDPEPR